MSLVQTYQLVHWKLSNKRYRTSFPCSLRGMPWSKKHKELLDKLKWCDESDTGPDHCRAHPCDINRRVLDDSGNISPLKANIYIDDILAAAAFKEYMLRLLAAIIEAIFLVSGVPHIAV